MNNIKQNSGMSLLEVMVSIAIGSMLMIGLVTTFRTSSDNYRELQKASDLIENGRYAMDVLYNDIRHAGYYGHYQANDLTYPTVAPDPCELTNTTNLLNALAVPVQPFPNATPTTIAATGCDELGFFTSTNDLKPGSDVVVIRRAETALFAGTDPDATSNPVTGVVSSANNNIGEVYLQANPRAAQVQIGVAATVNPLDTASGKTASNVTPTLRKMPGKTTATWADTRKLRVHIYYLSQCNAAAVCTGTDTPTLKRMELGDDDAGNTTMNIVPLVEGIEHFKIEYGLDTSPTSVDGTTGYIGDGMPDSYVAAPTLAQAKDIVAVRASVLARSLKTTNGYTNTKAFTVGPDSLPAANDSYKRNVYTTEIRTNNLAGRREIP